MDALVPSGVTAYQGSAATRRIPDAEGTLLTISKSADEIFDSGTPENNVFLAVNSLRRALLALDSPPDPPDPTVPTMEGAIDNVGTALKHLNGQLYFYGITQTRITASINHAVELETSLRAQVAQIQEVDFAEAASEFTQSKLALDAALTAKAQGATKSLFNYLA
jgi:flagellar hook-associated protein 3 FlgL